MPAYTHITLETHISTQGWVLLKNSALLLATTVPVFQQCCWDCLLWVLLFLPTLIITSGVDFMVAQRRWWFPLWLKAEEVTSKNSGETLFCFYLVIAFFLISPHLVDTLSYCEEGTEFWFHHPQKGDQIKKLKSSWQGLPTSHMQITLYFLLVYDVQIMASYTTAVKRQLCFLSCFRSELKLWTFRCIGCLM